MRNRRPRAVEENERRNQSPSVNPIHCSKAPATLLNILDRLHKCYLYRCSVVDSMSFIYDFDRACIVTTDGGNQ